MDAYTVTPPQPATRSVNPPARDLAWLISQFQPRGRGAAPDNVPLLKVNKVLKRAALAYERLRNAVDYQEERLLRRNAIGRLLPRHLMAYQQDAAAAKELLLDLIWSGYLPNDAIPETEAQRLAPTLARFRLVFQRCGQDDFEWWLGVAATELDRALNDSEAEYAWTDFAARALASYVTWPDNWTDSQRRLQLSLATLRSLLHADPALLRAEVVHQFYPGWRRNDPVEVQEVLGRLPAIRKAVEAHVSLRFGERVTAMVKRYSMLFIVLRDIIEHDPAQAAAVLADPAQLWTHAEAASQLRYGLLRQRLRRSASRSVIYVFFTKMLLALALEIPVAHLIYGTTFWPAVGVNVLFPPLLLGAIASLVRIPAQANTLRVYRGLLNLLGLPDGTRPQIILAQQQLSPGRAFAFRALYGIIFLTVFGLITYGLHRLRFTPLSSFIFLLFLCLVSFFGLRIRSLAREYIVVDRAESWLAILIDLISVPIVHAGRWISLQAPKVNLFLFVFDVVLEAPFRTVLGVFDAWLRYLREKQEEIS